MSYVMQNFEDGQVLTAENLNKMEEELAREKSWDDIGTVSGDTLFWDGDTSGLIFAANMFYKVSDAIPTIEDVRKGGHMVVISSEGSETMEIPPDTLEEDEEFGIIAFDFFVIVPSEAVGVKIEGDFTFPESGTYLICIPAYGLAVTELKFNGYTGFVNKSRVPKNRLPSKVKLYYRPDGDGDVLSVYTDVACSTVARIDDVPDELDFILGAVPNESQVVQYWTAPQICLCKAIATGVKIQQIFCLNHEGKMCELRINENTSSQSSE